jgi:hypothetical protein
MPVFCPTYSSKSLLIRDAGEPFEPVLADAGIKRLGHLLITVEATICALFQLTVHGGLFGSLVITRRLEALMLQYLLPCFSFPFSTASLYSI